MNLKPGSIAVRCPSCGDRPVESAAKLWHLRGILVWARYGTSFAIGCAPCVRAARRSAIVSNLLFGWWCFPWGFLTPIVALQNLTARSGRNQHLLTAFRRMGIPIGDVTLDEHGLSGEQRRLLWAYAHVAQRLTTCGQAELVLDAAAQSLVKMTSETIPLSATRANIVNAGQHGLPLTKLDGDDRMGLLAFAAYLATLNGRPGPAARAAVLALAVEFGLPEATADSFLNDNHPASSNETDVAAALSVLQVSKDASLAQVRQQYKALLIKNHPDRAMLNKVTVEEATRATQEVTAAYRILCAELGYTTL